MATQDSCKAHSQLTAEGWTCIHLPEGPDTPIPGKMLFAKSTHEVRMVLPDGRVVDPYALLHAVEDMVYNWGAGSKLPKFVGDFLRLIKVAEAMKGIRVEP